MPAETLQEVLELLRAKGIACVSATLNTVRNVKHPLYGFAAPGHKRMIRGVPNVAQQLGLQPKQVDRPDPAQGLPWLAGKLDKLYEGPAQDKEGWLTLLQQQGVACAWAGWHKAPSGFLSSSYTFRMQGHDTRARTVAEVAHCLGLSPKPRKSQARKTVKMNGKSQDSALMPERGRTGLALMAQVLYMT